MTQPGPKRLLALDGGGIRGLITTEVLAAIEKQLREKLGRGPNFVLADYFDYVAGTSTGAIIATCVSLGMSVDEIRQFYMDNGTAMFDKAGWLKRFHYKFEDDKLADKLTAVFDHYLPANEHDPFKKEPHVTLGSEALKTLLLIVMRNVTTDSPWPLSNNPDAKYNNRDRADCNLNIPLWQLVRASTAAPTYFPPENVTVGQHTFLFVDGGVTTYNNPAFLVFLMSTIGEYKLNWTPGADNMLLVSIGTGTNPNATAKLAADDLNLMYNASKIPAALMYAALNEQDILCRAFGRCRFGAPIDRELDTMALSLDAEKTAKLPRLFTYMRYNAELTPKGLSDLGVGDIKPEDVQKLDSVEHMKDLQRVGQAIVDKQVKIDHFAGFV